MSRRCLALHADGSRCRRTARPGAEFCWAHPATADRPPAPGSPASAATEAAPPRTPPGPEAIPRTPPPGDRVPPRDRPDVDEFLGLGGAASALRSRLEEMVGPNGRHAERGLIEFKDRLRRLSRRFPLSGWGPFERARELLTGELFDLAAWRGMLSLVLTQVEMRLEEGKRRARGEYEVDEFGFDEVYLERVRPFLLFLYRHWFRIEARGVENVPAEGRALLVANHSGVLPYDGAMVATALWEEHPHPRYLRALYWPGLGQLPFLSTMLHRTGQVVGCPENAEILLERDQLVIVFPEGVKGIGKRFRDRYRLQRFGRGGFARSAIATGAPLVPVAVIGAEEIHPLLWKSNLLGRLVGVPFLPITLTFPWLGPLGLIPLPTRWRIVFDEPIETSCYAPERAEDFVLVSRIAREVRDRIEGVILGELRKRRGIFR